MRFEHFDYLKSIETEYPIEQMRLRAKENGGAWLAECEEASRCADASLASILSQKRQIDTQIVQTVSKFAAEVRRAVEVLPRSQGVFTDDSNAPAFEVVCAVLLRVEAWKSLLQRSLNELLTLENHLRESRTVSAHALSFLSAAKRAAIPKQISSVEAWYEQTARDVQELDTLAEEVSERRRRLLQLMTQALPSVLGQLRADSDFDRAGKDCRASAVRARLGALLLMLEQSGFVGF